MPRDTGCVSGHLFGGLLLQGFLFLLDFRPEVCVSGVDDHVRVDVIGPREVEHVGNEVSADFL